MHVIVGRRGSGKSRSITARIGDGVGALIIVSTEKDLEYHRNASPNATVLLDSAITTVVMDDAEIVGATLIPHIATVNNPCAVPRDVSGTLHMLSEYQRSEPIIDALKGRFAFQHFAKSK